MIEPISEFWTRIFDFLFQFVPRERLPGGDLVAGVLLVVGIVSATLGAKLARPAVTLAFAGAGAAIAARYGGLLGIPLPVTVVVAAILSGLLGRVAFRLWVGVLMGATLALVALGIYGSAHILPHWQTFEAARVVERALPDATQQQGSAWETTTQTFRDFWAHLKGQQADVERNTLLIAAGAGIFGLVLGLWAARFTLVVSSATCGVLLVATASYLAAQCYWPHVLESLPTHAKQVDVAVLSFLAASLVLQALLTRRRPQVEPPCAE